MREVKFRAWEKHLKEMIPVLDINFEKKMINTDSAWRTFDEIELIQYTGLKDKNGKEICEGDILKHNYYEEPQQVIFSDRLIAYKLQPADVFIQRVDEDMNLIEVIGNIYKNPELVSN